MATPPGATAASPLTAAGVAGRFREIEARARGLAGKGGADATSLAARVLAFADRLMEGGPASREEALIEARRVLVEDHEKNTIRLSELVPVVRVGLRHLLEETRDAAMRGRLTVLLDIYGELEICLKALADAMIVHGMARQRLVMADKAKDTAARTRDAIGKVGFFS